MWRNWSICDRLRSMQPSVFVKVFGKVHRMIIAGPFHNSRNIFRSLDFLKATVLRVLYFVFQIFLIGFTASICCDPEMSNYVWTSYIYVYIFFFTSDMINITDGLWRYYGLMRHTSLSLEALKPKKCIHWDAMRTSTFTPNRNNCVIRWREDICSWPVLLRRCHWLKW